MNCCGSTEWLRFSQSEKAAMSRRKECRYLAAGLINAVCGVCAIAIAQVMAWAAACTPEPLKAQQPSCAADADTLPTECKPDRF